MIFKTKTYYQAVASAPPALNEIGKAPYMKRHISYKVLKISYYFISNFSNYYIYWVKHFDVLLSVFIGDADFLDCNQIRVIGL